MATFIPPQVPETAPDSEKKVHARLQDRLPSDWHVLHGTRLVRPAHGGHGPRESEIDFLVIAPRRGILVLEVKGGGIKLEGSKFLSRDKFGTYHEIKDPGAQAQGAMHQFKELVDRRRVIPKRRLFGHGVVLPDVTVSRDLGPGLPRAMVVDSRDLTDPKAALERIFDANGLTRQDDPMFLPRQVVELAAPELDLIPCLTRRFEEEWNQLLKLTEEQKRTLDAIQGIPRAVVRGGAGTGKTVVAMEKARRCASEGMRTLLLCYNEPLAKDLQQRSSEYRVRTFHALCRDLARNSGIPFRVPKDREEKRRFWDEEAADILVRALAKLPDERYDAVIVDEGQDFKEDWWIALEDIIADQRKAHFYVFLDPNQDLYGGGLSKEWDMPAIQLTMNCRNTVTIARYAGRFLDLEPNTRDGAPEGLAVGETEYTDSRSAVDMIRKTLHGWINERGAGSDSVVVLTTGSTRFGPVKHGTKMGNFTLVPVDAPLGHNEVRLETVRRFKGRESEAVLLFVADPEHAGRHNELYVATSRARHLLHVVRPVAES